MPDSVSVAFTRARIGSHGRDAIHPPVGLWPAAYPVRCNRRSVLRLGMGAAVDAGRDDWPGHPADAAGDRWARRPAKPIRLAATTGTPGSPTATTTIDGRTLPPPPAPFGGAIDLNAIGSTPSWPPRVVPPQGRAERPADHDRRRRLRRAVHLRRRHPDADARPHRQRRAALHQLPLDGALLADARGADHRAQPPLGRASA